MFTSKKFISSLFKNSNNRRISSFNSIYKTSSLFKTQKFNYSLLKDSQFLDEDQVSIQETAYTFAKNELLPNSHQWDLEQHFPVETFRKAAELGLSAIYTSEEVGGSGLGRLDASLIFEGLATGDVAFSAYLSIHNMCLFMVDSFANEEQKKLWIPDWLTMERLTSYCLTEPNSGSDAGAMKTTAVEKGDDFIINGTKCFISGAGVSEDYLLMCKTGEKEVSCIKVDKSCKGLSFGAKEKKVSFKLFVIF